MRGSWKYISLIALIFTIIVAVIFAYDIRQIRTHTIEKALTEARTLFDLNLAYRRWCAGHGGVYVPVTEKVLPNPYLSHPKRDLTASDGTMFTLINPAMMTRSVHNILSSSAALPIINKVTSLKFINPANRPDEWESNALSSFNAGMKEASEVVSINGEPYMRLLKPYMTEEGCLKCHSWQGYKVGDVRGGLSVGIPMRPFYEDEKIQTRNAVFTHLIIWGIGMAGLVFISGRLRRSEKKTEESEWKFRMLAEASSDWEYWINEDREIVFMSSSCLGITGYSPEEFTADPGLLLRIVHEDDRAAYKKHISDFMEPLHPEMELRIITKDNRSKWLSHICSPMYAAGRFVGRRETNRDISEKKMLESQLLQSQKMEALGLLAGGVAHDFNNILSVIMGYSSMLQEGRGDLSCDDAQRYLGIIAEAAERAHGLTTNLLSFSRKQEIKPVRIDLQDMIKSMRPLLKSIMGDDIEMKITHSSSRTKVYADPSQMQQVFLNLATNARDAMKSAGIFSIETDFAAVDAERAAVYELSAGDYVVISVSDTGSGMDKNVVEHIFEPFFTTKEKGKGTGLGLAIVYGVIKQQNGFVKVYSEKNIGTTFRIYLPSAEDLPEGQLAPKPRATEGLEGSETILVVEDDELMREFLGDSLCNHGYKPIFAGDGDAAISVYNADKENISLLLIDMVLPKRNGREVFESIRAVSPEIRAVFMSGYSREVLNAKGLFEEGFEYITKPLVVNELLTKVRSVLDGRRG